MGFWDFFRHKSKALPLQSGARALAGGGRVGGRLTRDRDDDLLSSSWLLVPPPDYESNWRTLRLDSSSLDNIAPSKLLEMLADLSPEVSSQLWYFLRLCNPGWTVEALRPATGGDSRRTIDDRAQAQLHEFIKRLEDQYGSADIVFNRLFMAAFLRGAMLGELVLDRHGRLPADLATPDPHLVRFRKQSDPVRGAVWQMGQWQGGQFVVLDRETIRYVPIDPFPGSPYGRPLASPALFTSLFLLGMLHDLKRVIQQQGYPRIDLSIDTAKLLDSMPHLGADTTAYQEWMQAIVNEVQAVYDALEPDDAYIHSDVVTVNRPVGTVDSESLGAVGMLITSLERMATRALKSMPLLMGMESASGETHANRQWEIQAAGIKSIQHQAETLLGRLFGLALQAQGIDAEVVVRFAELRAAEMMRDAQTETMQIDNARKKYDAGWISQDEASEEVTGHKADAPEPRQSLAGVQFQTGADLSEDRGRRIVDASRYAPRGGQRLAIIPNGSNDPLPVLPSEPEPDDDSRDRALLLWAAVAPAAVRGLLTEDGGWVWEPDRHRYKNQETGQIIREKDLVELRDLVSDGVTARLLAHLESMFAGDITIQRWILDMRRELEDGYVVEYALGKGGAKRLNAEDYAALGGMLLTQYIALQNFGQQLAQGQVSTGQASNRTSMYGESTTAPFEVGWVAAWGVPTLPQYPGDGNTQCGTNCRCHWRIEETETEWLCTWILDPGAEHCDDCTGNAAVWSPLVIAK